MYVSPANEGRRWLHMGQSFETCTIGNIRTFSGSTPHKTLPVALKHFDLVLF